MKKSIERYQYASASGMHKSVIAKKMAAEHPLFTKIEFKELLIAVFDMEKTTAETYYQRYIKPKQSNNSDKDKSRINIKCDDKGIDYDPKYDALVLSIANYINSFKDNSLKNWLKENYSWPRKTGRNTSWDRIKLYALFDKFYAHKNNKILSKDTSALLETNLKYQQTESLNWARSFLKQENYNSAAQTLIKHGDIKFNFKETSDIKSGVTTYLRSTAIHTDDYLQAVSFFIEDWGGVTTNRFSKLADYVRLYEDFDTTNHEYKKYFSLEGVATWSKYLSVIHPEEMLIYDARICFSLNALIFLDELSVPYWAINEGGRTGSRNSKIKKVESYVNDKLKQNTMMGNDFYHRYLNIMHKVAQKIGGDTQAEHVEMFLFSVADASIYEAVVDKIKKTDI